MRNNAYICGWRTAISKTLDFIYSASRLLRYDSKPTASQYLIKKSCEILIKGLGVNQATGFVAVLERGEGETIIDVENYWSNASVDEIHNQISKGKEIGELQL